MNETKHNNSYFSLSRLGGPNQPAKPAAAKAEAIIKADLSNIVWDCYHTSRRLIYRPAGEKH